MIEFIMNLWEHIDQRELFKQFCSPFLMEYLSQLQSCVWSFLNWEHIENTSKFLLFHIKWVRLLCSHILKNSWLLFYMASIHRWLKRSLVYYWLQCWQQLDTWMMSLWSKENQRKIIGLHDDNKMTSELVCDVVDTMNIFNVSEEKWWHWVEARQTNYIVQSSLPKWKIVF